MENKLIIFYDHNNRHLSIKNDMHNRPIKNIIFYSVDGGTGEIKSVANTNSIYDCGNDILIERFEFNFGCQRRRKIKRELFLNQESFFVSDSTDGNCGNIIYIPISKLNNVTYDYKKIYHENNTTHTFCDTLHFDIPMAFHIKFRSGYDDAVSYGIKTANINFNYVNERTILGKEIDDVDNTFYTKFSQHLDKLKLEMMLEIFDIQKKESQK